MSLIMFKLRSPLCGTLFSLHIHISSHPLSSLFLLLQLFDIIVVTVPEAVRIAMYSLATCL